MTSNITSTVSVTSPGILIHSKSKPCEQTTNVFAAEQVAYDNMTAFMYCLLDEKMKAEKAIGNHSRDWSRQHSYIHLIHIFIYRLLDQSG